MTIADEVFLSAGQKPGIEIWRIEKMQVVPVEEKFHGRFYDGDSYIILKTNLKGEALEWDVHFWLGQDTSQDEQGVAAYKTVELDDHLRGAPVQYREVQEHESKKFLSYFRKSGGIKYLKGGVASGFKHVVEEKVEPRLFQVKGKRNVRVRQVEMGCNSLNKGDCFILDNGDDIFVWVGPDSGRMERLKAMQAAKEIRDNERQGASKIHLIDETANDAKFFEALGGKGEIASAEAGGDDAEHGRKKDTEISLYRVSEDASGKMSSVRVGEKPLNQKDLVSEDSFILDSGTSGIFIWIGKKSSKKERASAMTYATNYLKFKNYPAWTPIQRVIEDGETPAFKQFFSAWKDEGDQEGLGKTYQKGTIAPSEPLGGLDLSSNSRRKKVYGLSSLHQKSSGRAVGFMPDDGSGKVEIFRVENFELQPLDPAAYGMFFGGDSYVLRYTYEKNNMTGYIVYFWQGNKSTQDEKAASAIHAIKLDDDVGGKAVQVRVVQNNEPDHFLRIFKGKMVTLMGGKASGFKNIHDHDSYDVDGTRLFQVQGTDEFNTRAMQVEEKARSLRSGDVFVLETPSTTYLWHGSGSTNEEKEMGGNLVNIVSPGRKVETVKEGSEPDAFWSALGGKSAPQPAKIQDEGPYLPPRLFQCSNASGRLRVEEITDFTKDDLEGDDVMILDTGDEVFVWVGQGANEEEKKVSFDVAKEFIDTDPTGRRSVMTTVILQVKQGAEPEAFRANFSSWA